jgi:hypothetical protein
MLVVLGFPLTQTQGTSEDHQGRLEGDLEGNLDGLRGATLWAMHLHSLSGRRHMPPV